MEKIEVKIVFLIALMLCSSTAALSQQEQIFMTLSRFEMQDDVMTIWWTDELTDFMAWQGRGADDLLGQKFMKNMKRDYHIFLVSHMSTGDPLEESGRITLRNDSGVAVENIDPAPVINEMYHGFRYFPVRDEEGREVISSSTKVIYLDIKMPGENNEYEFKWKLPVEYPPEVEEACKWIEESEATGYLGMDMNADELMGIKYMSSSFMDIQSGIVTMPLSKNFLDFLISTDEEMQDEKDNDLLYEFIEEYDVYLLMTAEEMLSEGEISMSGNSRLAELAWNSVAIDESGKVHKVDVKESKELFQVMEEGSAPDAVPIVFEKMCSNPGSISLQVMDPETGYTSNFEWECGGF